MNISVKCLWDTSRYQSYILPDAVKFTTITPPALCVSYSTPSPSSNLQWACLVFLYLRFKPHRSLAASHLQRGNTSYFHASYFHHGEVRLVTPSTRHSSCHHSIGDVMTQPPSFSDIKISMLSAHFTYECVCVEYDIRNCFAFRHNFMKYKWTY